MTEVNELSPPDVNATTTTTSITNRRCTASNNSATSSTASSTTSDDDDGIVAELNQVSDLRYQDSFDVGARRPNDIMTNDVDDNDYDFKAHIRRLLETNIGIATTALNSCSSNNNMMIDDDDDNIVSQEDIHKADPSSFALLMAQPNSPQFADSSSSETEPSHQHMIQVNQTNSVAVTPRVTAAPQSNNFFFNGAPPWNGNNSQQQARLQQSPSLPVVADITSNAVIFGLGAHSPTREWRKIVKLFSDDHVKYKIWSDDICDQVILMLKQKGYTTFFVSKLVTGEKRADKNACKRNNGKRYRNKTKIRIPLLDREATYEEIVEKTRERFKEDRRNPRKPRKGQPIVNVHQTADAHAASASSHPILPPGIVVAASFPKAPPLEVQQENVARNVLVSNCKPFYPIAERDVCFDWDTHPGTIKYFEVVASFAANKAIPTWTDDIAALVKWQLEKEGVNFLVFLDATGKPCVNRNGLWNVASHDDILERTRKQFLSSRQRLAEELDVFEAEGVLPGDGHFKTTDSAILPESKVDEDAVGVDDTYNTNHQKIIDDHVYQDTIDHFFCQPLGIPMKEEVQVDVMSEASTSASKGLDGTHWYNETEIRCIGVWPPEAMVNIEVPDEPWQTINAQAHDDAAVVNGDVDGMVMFDGWDDN